PRNQDLNHHTCPARSRARPKWGLQTNQSKSQKTARRKNSDTVSSSRSHEKPWDIWGRWMKSRIRDIRKTWYPVTGFPTQRSTPGVCQRQVGSFAAQPWGPSIWISSWARTNAIAKKYMAMGTVMPGPPPRTILNISPQRVLIFRNPSCHRHAFFTHVP